MQCPKCTHGPLVEVLKCCGIKGQLLHFQCLHHAQQSQAESAMHAGSTAAGVMSGAWVPDARDWGARWFSDGGLAKLAYKLKVKRTC